MPLPLLLSTLVPLKPGALPDTAADAGKPSNQPSPSPCRRQELPFSAIFTYPAVMWLLGFLPATAMFLFWAARHNKKGWPYALILCFALSTAIYAVLNFGFDWPLPLGVFIQWMER